MIVIKQMTSESSMSFFLYSREKAIILPSSLKNGYSLSPRNGDHNTLFSFLVGFTLPPNVVFTFFQNFAQNESSSVTYQYSAASCSESQARTIFLFWYLILLDLNTAFTASSSFFSSSSVGVQSIDGSVPTVKAVWMFTISCSNGMEIRFTGSVLYFASIS